MCPRAEAEFDSFVLGAAYMLRLYQQTMFGEVTNPKNEKLSDLSFREFATFAPLLVLAFWIGLYPKPFLERLETSVDRVMVRIDADYTPRLASLSNANADTDADLDSSAASMLAETPGPVRGGSR